MAMLANMAQYRHSLRWVVRQVHGLVLSLRSGWHACRNPRDLAGTGPAACACPFIRLSTAADARCSGCSEEITEVKHSRRRLGLPQTGHLAMLELVGSLSAAFLSELGTAELMVGLLFAAGLVGCAA